MIDVPTNWQQMRYCIVAALDKLGGDDEFDRHDLYTGIIQFQIEATFGGQGPREAGWRDWTDRSPYGKAFERAMDSLLEDGTIVRLDANRIENRLAWWGDPATKE